MADPYTTTNGPPPGGQEKDTMARTRISFDSISYTAADKAHHAMPTMDRFGRAVYPGDTRFFNRLAAQNRRYASAHLRATNRWADKLSKANPGQGVFLLEDTAEGYAAANTLLGLGLTDQVLQASHPRAIA